MIEARQPIFGPPHPGFKGPHPGWPNGYPSVTCPYCDSDCQLTFRDMDRDFSWIHMVRCYRCQAIWARGTSMDEMRQVQWPLDVPQNRLHLLMLEEG